MGVVAIWRYPVKAMLGELLDAVEVGSGGCRGDRRWVVVDTQTGERIANKRGPTDPRLRACRAELLDLDAEMPLRITFPDGDALEGGEIEAALSVLLERSVRLERSSDPATGSFLATGAHHDFAPVHLVTTSTLAHLRTLRPASDWDVRRFRPNLLLDDGHEPGRFSEDELLGGQLHARSGLRLRVGLPTPRCVVPTRAQENAPADPGILRTLVEEHRIDLGPFGRQGCVGAYADVVHPGSLAVGERLAVEAGTQTPSEATQTTLQSVVDRMSPS